MARPIRINGVKNSHRKTVIPMPIAPPFITGFGNQPGGLMPMSASVEESARATNTETIPFQNADTPSSATAPPKVRCEAPIVVPNPDARCQAPLGGRVRSNAGSIPVPRPMVENECDRLQLRQNARSAATFTSLLGMIARHLGQVGVVM